MEIETTSLDHASSDASWLVLVVAGLVLVPGFVIALVGAARSFMRARAVVAAERGALPALGGEGVVVGIVERLEDDAAPGPFVRAEVRQRGYDTTNKGTTYRVWSGDGLPITTARPFGLRLASGALVRVEPGESVRLLDALDGTEIVDTLERLRFASLDEGERAQVLGAIEERPAPGGGYRDAGKALALVAPASGETWIAGEDELYRVLKKRTLGYAIWAAGFALITTVLLAGPASNFLALSGRGAAIYAVIDRVEIRTTLHKGNTRYHFTLTATAGEGAETRTLTAPIRESAVSEIVGEPWKREKGALKALPGRITRFFQDRGDPSSYVLGTRAAMSDDAATGVLIVTVIACALFAATWAWLRPWWEKSLVNETERL